MIRKSIIYAAAAALALATSPALAAQDPPTSPKGSQGTAGARPNPSGGSSGSAVSRPSGGSSSGSSTSSSAGSSSSGGSSVSRPSGSSSSDGYRAPARPERRPENRAVARDRGTNSDSGDRRRVNSPAGASASSGDDSDGRRAVPAYSRPREGRPTVGSANERRFPAPRPGDGGSGYYYDPYYRYSYYYNRYPGNYYWPGYGFGVGYFYDPWMWGSFSPYGGGYYDPYYAGGSGGYSTYRQGAYRSTGALRLKVKPNQGQVFVDGYYVGEIDSFDGVFQRLTIEEGPHRVEIRAPGFETVQFEVMVIPGETVTYKGELKRIQ